MKTRRSASPRAWLASSPGQLLATLVAYLTLACVLVGVIGWISPGSVWSALSPVLAGFIVLLLTSAPPVRRWYARFRAGRWGDGRPGEHWD